MILLQMLLGAAGVPPGTPAAGKPGAAGAAGTPGTAGAAGTAGTAGICAHADRPMMATATKHAIRTLPFFTTHLLRNPAKRHPGYKDLPGRCQFRLRLSHFAAIH